MLIGKTTNNEVSTKPQPQAHASRCSVARRCLARTRLDPIELADRLIVSRQTVSQVLHDGAGRYRRYGHPHFQRGRWNASELAQHATSCWPVGRCDQARKQSFTCTAVPTRDHSRLNISFAQAHFLCPTIGFCWPSAMHDAPAPGPCKQRFQAPAALLGMGIIDGDLFQVKSHHVPVFPSSKNYCLVDGNASGCMWWWWQLRACAHRRNHGHGGG